jgi:3-dehydroquinate synthase
MLAAMRGPGATISFNTCSIRECGDALACRQEGVPAMGVRRVVLIGLSGAGKSTVGQVLAETLGWRLIDMDAEIERRAGRSIPAIFREDGEPAFRRMERALLAEALGTVDAVVSTGGGAVASDEVWDDGWLASEGTLTVLLDAPTRILFDRLVAQQARDPSGAVRPMLEGDDPYARIEALAGRRAPWYRRARVVVPVADRSVEEIAGVIAGAVAPDAVHEVVLEVPGGTSTIRVGSGVVGQLGARLRERWPKARRVWVVADAGVAPYHLNRVVEAIGEDTDARSLTFPAGEASKSLAGLDALYDDLLGGGIERSDVIVALGGGVAGDLVGFAAATVLRGVGLVQVPTTLLAMVDSSVGGKTGVNHPAGKNLIGAFYQPPVVLIDPDLLETLPDREYRSGWAEIVKHGLIEPSTPAGDSGLFDLVASNAEALAARRSSLLSGIIARNVEIKASVVRADEREAGLRAILNFGHTLGHAVEAAGYRLLHGEAIAVGLHAAMRLGVALGRVTADRADEVRDVLARFGLPTEVEADAGTIRRLMQSDKKRISGEQLWIVPSAGGGVTIERGVPHEAADAALAAILR